MPGRSDSLDLKSMKKFRNSTVLEEERNFVIKVYDAFMNAIAM